MRDWDKHRDDWSKMGIQLVVLTADPPNKLKLGVKKHGLPTDFLYRVEPSVWADLDITHETRPELPIPTTWIVAPDGSIVWSTQTAAYSKRVSAKKVLNRIREHRSTRASTTAK